MEKTRRVYLLCKLPHEEGSDNVLIYGSEYIFPGRHRLSFLAIVRFTFRKTV
jgi:hypothetical protein